MATIQVKNRVFLTSDGKEAVAEGDPRAASLLVGANGRISEEIANKYGVTEDGVKLSKGADAKPPAGASLPHGVNPNSPDGVNTAPGSPAAMGIRETAEAALAAPAAPSKAEPAADTAAKAKGKK